MIFTKENRADFEKANVCFICNNNRGMKGRKEHPFCESDPKVRDHDYVNGLYLGAAHKTCNLNKRREKPFLSVFCIIFLVTTLISYCRPLPRICCQKLKVLVLSQNQLKNSWLLKSIKE